MRPPDYRGKQIKKEEVKGPWQTCAGKGEALKSIIYLHQIHGFKVLNTLHIISFVLYNLRKLLVKNEEFHFTGGENSQARVSDLLYGKLSSKQQCQDYNPGLHTSSWIQDFWNHHSGL